MFPFARCWETMTKAVRIYEMGRGRRADDIQLVDKLMLVVNTIDEPSNKVSFTANANIVDYQATPTSQSIGFKAIEGDTRMFWVGPKDEPVTHAIDGTTYHIAVNSIGKENEGGRRWAYCDFAISW